MINLAFYCYPKKGAVADFREVARRIGAANPQIAAHVFATQTSLRTTLGSLALAARPTLAIEMDTPRFAPVLRGRRLYHIRGIGKTEQAARLSAAGVRVPKAVRIEAGTSLSEADWGPYVVVKPERGKRGAYVWIHRTRRVRFKPPSDYPLDHPGRRAPMLAQEFIHTGPYPTAYRVLTFLGEPLHAMRYEGRRGPPPLNKLEDFSDGGGGRTIVASAHGCTISAANDADVIDIARRAHAVFPDVPSLGIDIVRDYATGDLFVLETNPGGNSWTLSGPTADQMRQQFGLDFHGQFGALDIMARVAASAALRLAR
jgi:hypothetical protein